MHDLPDGDYPFGAEMYALSRLAMTEAPPELQAFLQEQAARAGIEIVRDEPVELVCLTPEMETQKFFVFWPTDDRMHLLVPKEMVVGRA